MFFKVILTVIIGYLLGCISAAYLIGKKFGHIDIRQYGSGNAGFFLSFLLFLQEYV